MSDSSVLPAAEAEDDAHLYRQIYDRFRGAIAAGTLKPGDRIPSARALAKELGVARGTVELAYSLLAAEGYVQARGQAGTIVTPGLQVRPLAAAGVAAAGVAAAGAAGAGTTGHRAGAPARPAAGRYRNSDGPVSALAYPPASAPSPTAEHGIPAASNHVTVGLTTVGLTTAGLPPAGRIVDMPAIPPFQMGLPALDAFPRKIWARLGARHLRAAQPPDLAYPAPGGLASLRQAIAAYLHMARGIACAPKQVFVTSGYNASMQLAVHALLQPGARAWVEDPGYPPTRALLAQLNIPAVPVPVDDDGLDVARGIARADDASLAVVTPAHQSPLSVSLSLPRRQALLQWAERRSAWIFEDDYDGEYRYVSRPLPALKSLDRGGRVLYAGTFSKVMFPSIRLAYLVVPPELCARFEDVARVTAGGVPWLTQAVTQAFMAEGHFARHIQRMRRLYAQRRAACAAGLAQVLGDRMHVEPQPGGMHLLLRLHAGQSDHALVARMLEHGMYAQTLSQWYSEAPAGGQGLLVSFTNVENEAQAVALARKIRAVMP
ncbi:MULTISPECIES: PLP-dependent aminotransferase family protein [unclassified Achromobacter]|uniref:MocR-like pyridoxine biosynthesis transcription factor PdxR n=1 Tax=unclassified Achromobacter TaxID=2626865 RepID=UPI000B517657|nr:MULTISPECIES: PLP-dependent aminotransferase family protein [unclassified Achromobacter]OWT71547.1 DNA-binding protein [Achromobacter sp. HZ34]OWT73204.1 DNA-binding protein [Achromobacter sp. HZ28]